ncbi:hypothetical protein BH10ACT2_BH10ACT2_23960 [soil metagenome]
MSRFRSLAVGLVVVLPLLLAVNNQVSAAPPPADMFHGLVPARLMDTRVGSSTVAHLFEGGGKVGTGSTTNLTALNRGGVPSEGVGAVVLNVTSVAPTVNGFVTVWPTGLAKPDASNLNLRAGTNVPDMVIVPVGAGGQISLSNARTTPLPAISSPTTPTRRTTSSCTTEFLR